MRRKELTELSNRRMITRRNSGGGEHLSLNSLSIWRSLINIIITISSIIRNIVVVVVVIIIITTTIITIISVITITIIIVVVVVVVTKIINLI
jgi:hypothetical protein